ncbi:hypothetical protein FHS18_004674 [Paenibacillus phyllosphaerae]|uniref:DUF3221 domain-containing protein n=1 Tax=Paenibacillus phyllosphaerae TaxID=274593 RepID=A0A7W5FPT7_9BACL|nr:DUF3221 domain-containing protein [Paenibacillus phyllosphaerae]MBB3112573.1 hypothetical protein [Paenibacillus phyllosphaerae]
MKRKSILRTSAVLVLAAALVSACGSKEQNDVPSAPQASAPDDGVSGQAGGEVDNPAGQPVAASPESIRSFLSEADFKNGDIYLNGGKLHVNVVGLTAEIERQFAARFTADTYVLHDAKFSILELEAAQQKLMDSGLFDRYNIMGSSVDVINNQVSLDLPEENKDGVAVIEEALGKDIVAIHVAALGEPEIVGVITTVDTEGKRVLIQEEGSPEPNYWFSWQDDSMLENAAGKQAEFADFSVGTTVQIWSTGAVADSMPAQGTIRKMAIAPDSK